MKGDPYNELKLKKSLPLPKPARLRRYAGHYTMENNCFMCTDLDNEFMLTCVTCKRKVHRGCVLLRDNGISSETWRCADCLFQSDAFSRNMKTNRSPSISDGAFQSPSKTSNVSNNELLTKSQQKVDALAQTLKGSSIKQSTSELERHRLTAERATRENQDLKERIKLLEATVGHLTKDSHENSVKRLSLDSPKGSEASPTASEKINATRLQNLRRTIFSEEGRKVKIPNRDELGERDKILEFMKTLSANLPDMIKTLGKGESSQRPDRMHNSAPPRKTEFSFEANQPELVVSMHRQYIQKLPKFDGDIRDWAYFESVFNDTTAQGKFNERENVGRLREALTGQAKKIVLGEVMFSTNASDIMTTLRKTFGDARTLIATLAKELMETPVMKSDFDKGLLDFTSNVNAYCANIKALGKTRYAGDLTNELLLTTLAQKLCPSHRTRWERRRQQNSSSDIRDFKEFLTDVMLEIPHEWRVTEVKTTKEESFKGSRLNVHVEPASVQARSIRHSVNASC